MRTLDVDVACLDIQGMSDDRLTCVDRSGGRGAGSRQRFCGDIRSRRLAGNRLQWLHARVTHIERGVDG